MKDISYSDINRQFPKLNSTLCNCLLEGKLCIAQLNLDCEKLKTAIDNRKALFNAKYVIFSKDMINYHRDEIFLFIDDLGEIVDKVHGNEFWLYDMIDICTIKNEIKNLH